MGALSFYLAYRFVITREFEAMQLEDWIMSFSSGCGTTRTNLM